MKYKEKCYGCNRGYTKLEGNFYPHKTNTNGYEGRCIKCHKEYAKKYYKGLHGEIDKGTKLRPADKEVVGRKVDTTIKCPNGFHTYFGAESEDRLIESLVIPKKHLWMGSIEREYSKINR